MRIATLMAVPFIFALGYLAFGYVDGIQGQGQSIAIVGRFFGDLNFLFLLILAFIAIGTLLAVWTFVFNVSR